MTIKKVNNLIKAIFPQLWQRKDKNATLHCTIALKGGNIIAYGFNDFNKYCPEYKFGKYRAIKNTNCEYIANIHSEIDLLKKISFRKDLHKITLLNIRINKKGEKVISMPCHNCLRILYKYNFKAIYYTISENQIGKISWSEI